MRVLGRLSQMQLRKGFSLLSSRIKGAAEAKGSKIEGEETGSQLVTNLHKVSEEVPLSEQASTFELEAEWLSNNNKAQCC